jgi:membrane peptidoglycan carboxypeptidase
MSAQNPPRRALLSALLGVLAFSVIAGLLVAASITPAIAVSGVAVNSTIGVFDNLPTFIEIGKQAEQNRIFATKGKKNVQIATLYSQNRQEVTWGNVSKYAKAAAVDGEDRRFYSHGGVDIAGIVRAAITNVACGCTQQGASTIAQQLVKNIYIAQALEITDPVEQKKQILAAQATTLDRKLKEMKLAISLEKKYSKDEILLAYLNIAGFGGNTYGIEAAAQQYYSTSAKNLTIAQAASLLAIVQQPGARDLATPAHYAANKQRRDVILTAMAQAGDITTAQRDEAIATPVDKTTVKISPPKNGCLVANKYARFWCDYIRLQVPKLTALGTSVAERKKNWQHGGYDIYTTLDLSAQTAAQRITSKYAPKNTTLLKLGSSTVSVQVGTGRILVMTENKDFNDTAKGGGRDSTSVNFATDLPDGGSTGFQVGSTYKPFTLITWLKAGHGLNEIVNANPRTEQQSSFKDSCNGPWGGPWTFRNDSGETGNWTVAAGTAASVNGVFVSMAKQLDLCDIEKTAASLGVHRADMTPLRTNPSSVLGINEIAPLTMAAAYAGIANSGIFCDPIAVDYVIDPSGAKVNGQPKTCTRAVDADVDNTAAFAMQAVMTGGTGAAANPNDGTQLIGKTGTTDASVHTWIVGASRKVATAVWVGNISGKVALRSVSLPTGGAALQRHNIFRDTMAFIDRRYHAGPFPAPSPQLLTGSGTRLPDLQGLSFADAQAQLQGAGFTVVDGGKVSSSLPAGQVVRTNPAAGSLLSRGGSVTLFTSKGNLIAVPDVVGNGKNTFQDAVNILAGAGFNHVKEVCKPISTPADDGHVRSSNPSYGHNGDPSKTVQVTVGRVSCP